MNSLEECLWKKMAEYELKLGEGEVGSLYKCLECDGRGNNHCEKYLSKKMLKSK